MHRLEDRAVFLDRDGVINHNRPDYVKAWEEFEFLPGALRALTRLAKSPFRIVVVTNQSAVGRGLVSKRSIRDIHERMQLEIRRVGGRLDAIYYCPHNPADSCECRKPRPGLLLKAAGEFSLDLKASWFIGDQAADVQAALAASVRPILLKTGRGSGISTGVVPGNVLMFDDLDQATESLLAFERIKNKDARASKTAKPSPSFTSLPT